MFREVTGPYINYEGYMRSTHWTNDITAAVVEAAADFVHSMQADSKGIEDTGKYDVNREDHVRNELGIWVAYKETGSSFDDTGMYNCGRCDMRKGKDECTHVQGKISFAGGSCRLFICGPNLEGKPDLPQKLTKAEAQYSEYKNIKQESV